MSNSLSAVHPELVSEWSEKNLPLTPDDITFGSNKKVWWKECVAIHRAHQEHVPNCMRPLINKKLKLMSELTEHTLANEIEAPHEILRK